MTVVAAALAGYLIGSLPTANTLAGLWGVNLRTSGSGNPGANNARRLAGLTPFFLILGVEMGKGVLAVLVGHSLAGDLGAVTAGLGAAAGNVYNVWYWFGGGKGLAITLGILLAAWPTFVPFGLLIIGVSAAVTRSSGIGALVALAGLFLGAVIWAWAGLDTGWGVEDVTTLLVLGIGIPLVLWQRHWADAKKHLRAPVPL